jgi:hypothetical protein
VGDDLLYNGSVKTIISANKLHAGNYTATAVFYGDGNYEELTLNGIDFTVSRVTPTIDAVINDATYPRPVFAIVNLGNNANGTVNVTVDRKTFKKAVVNGEVSVELSGLSAGNKEAIIEFFSDDDYNDDVRAFVKFTVYPNNSLVVLNYDQTYHVGDNIEMEIQTVNSTGDLKVYINGQLYNTLYYDYLRVYTVDFGELGEGSYVVTVSLDGDVNFIGYSTSASFNIVKNDLAIDLDDVGDICVDSPVIFKAILNQTVSGEVLFTINGINYTVYADNEDTVTYEYTPVNNATISVVARFMGNDMYNANESSPKQFNVTRIPTTIDVSFYSPLIAGDDARIEVSMNPEINCAALLIVNDKIYDVAIVDGWGAYTVSNLANATYDVKATFEGDDRYDGSTSDVKQLYVNMVITNLNISIDKTSMSYHDSSVVSIVLDHSMNAVVTVKVNGRNHTVGLVNGKGSFTLYGLDNGNYTINAVFAGDDRYVRSISNALNLTVNSDSIPSTVSISLNKDSVFVDEEVIITVNSNPTVTGIIKLNIGSYSYDVAVKNGVGTFRISNLANGIYDVQAVFDGDNIHLGNSSDVKRLEVKRIPTELSLIIDNSSIFVGDSVVVSVILNQSINNVVTVNFNGKDYLIGIVNGKGNLTLSGLAFGTYNVNATFAGEGKYVESTSNTAILAVNKIKTQLSANAITAVYNVGKYLVITLKDSNGNAIRNSVVTVNLNGAKTLRTDNNGNVKVSTKALAPNSYTAKISFKGNAIYEGASKDVKVVVNRATPKITSKAATFKKSVKTKKYTVTLNVNQKVKVAIKVNKKTYYAYTTTKGVAIFKITQLTKEGKYTATVSSVANKYYNKAKPVNVKITVK